MSKLQIKRLMHGRLGDANPNSINSFLVTIKHKGIHLKM